MTTNSVVMTFVFVMMTIFIVIITWTVMMIKSSLMTMSVVMMTRRRVRNLNEREMYISKQPCPMMGPAFHDMYSPAAATREDTRNAPSTSSKPAAPTSPSLTSKATRP